MRETPIGDGRRGPEVSPDADRAILEHARRTIRIEAASVSALAGRLGESFVSAVRRILEAPGRVVVTGVGKSGLVARKIASTLASTGTPALFLHPVEGIHGDMGVILRGDVLLAVSRSGESPELGELLPAVGRLEVPVIALTGRSASTLGRYASVMLDVSVEEEACPADLTPTASSTAALAMGDALAMALLRLRDFGPDDYARLHPGGALGRRLLWRVRDVMLDDVDQVPRLGPDAELRQAMHEIAHRRGTVPVVDGEGRVVGVITAGDLTRFAENRPDFLVRPVQEAMNPEPRVIAPDALAVEAARALERHGIMALPVVDDARTLVGIVHLHDLLRAGVTP